MKRPISLILCIVLLSLCFACSSNEEQYYTVESTVFSSGLVFSAQISGGNEEKTAEKMLDFLDNFDEVFNANKANTAVSRFNEAKAGEEVEVDESLYYLARQSKLLYEQTLGAFNVAITPVSKAWGVDVDGINKYAYGGQTPPPLPSRETLDALSLSVDLSALQLTSRDGKYYLKKTVDSLTLDFGGIAKGYCVDELKRIATENGVKSGIISISGNLYLIGKNESGDTSKKWGVGVNNPRRTATEPDQYVCGFYESDASVVTSGDYERCYDYLVTADQKIKICHIIDGRTLMPIGVKRNADGTYVQSSDYVISATVIGESSLVCDAYATAVCVLGIDAGAKLLRDNGYEGIIFTADKKYLVVGETEMADSITLYKTAYAQK